MELSSRESRELRSLRGAVRRLRLGLGALAVAFSWIIVQGQQQPIVDSVTARSFYLADDEGVKAMLVLGPGGTPSLVMYDAQKRKRVHLGVVADADGTPVLTMTAPGGAIDLGLSNGEPALSLLDKDGMPRAFMGVMKAAPVVKLLDPAGQTKVFLGDMGSRGGLLAVRGRGQEWAFSIPQE